MLDLVVNERLWVDLTGQKLFFVRLTEDGEGQVRVIDARTNEPFVSGIWALMARFIREKSIDEIDIDDEELYLLTLRQLAFAFVSQPKLAIEGRKQRYVVLLNLIEEEPGLAKVMSFFDR